MKKWHTVQDYLVIVFCACLLALSYHIFVFPNEFAPSGLPGIATIIQHVFHFKVGYMTILINVPLVLLTYFIVDHRYAVLSATFAVVFSVVLLALDYVNLAPFEYHTTTGTSTILAPIAGGVISGFCYGMVMRRDSSTGGTDLLAALVHHVRPEMHIIWIVFAINAIVAALSYFVYDFKIEPVILCLIYCFLSSHVGDTMIKGFKEAVKFEIVTDKPEELSTELLNAYEARCYGDPGRRRLHAFGQDASHLRREPPPDRGVPAHHPAVPRLVCLPQLRKGDHGQLRPHQALKRKKICAPRLRGALFA